MKNIHILPTDKPSRIIKSQDNDFILLNTNVPNWFEINLNTTKQNIYITSDEEIKEGDWILENNTKLLKWKMSYSFPSEMSDICKKIIITTDQDLIKEGVQAIDDEFLEWFVKNPSCEMVEVQKFNGFAEDYLIIIPKEEPKQDLPIVNGSYGCIIQTKKQEPKQETLEEAAKECLRNNNLTIEGDFTEGYITGLLFGVKWQQEQDKNKYSEEEVKHLMTLAFEQGFKKADIVEAGLEAKETDTEVNWIFLKHKK